MRHPTKYIFVTGGVVSSLGKGITAAAIGMLLEARGYHIRLTKFDPYMNVDPGTMSPYEHGEVYVTDDGSETDLDLGHYSRFTGAEQDRTSNYTSGRIYYDVITRERRGDYLGKTVQLVPHITDAIKDAFKTAAKSGVDIVIHEIGGTVGDIEGLAFIEAMRQMPFDVGRENILFIHLTLLPFLRASGEVKTKPTQQSVGKLREIGVQPDILICRTELPITPEVRRKIGMFCNLDQESVYEEKDVDFSIYQVPVVLHEQNLDAQILHRLSLPAKNSNLDAWRQMLHHLQFPVDEVEIAICGKYTELRDAYKSIFEALTHGGIPRQIKVKLRCVSAEELDQGEPAQLLAGAHGLLVPGGFGERGLEGKIKAIGHARTTGLPFLGICLGMQLACIEFARNVCSLEGAHSAEVDPDVAYRIIGLMDQQRRVVDKGGTMRLGAYPCQLAKGSLAAQVYGARQISERHRHRYEFNNSYRELFEQHGWRFSGLSPDGQLVELSELPAHPWFLATQFHPEFKSGPLRPHPLFKAFVEAAQAYRQGKLRPAATEAART